MKDALNQAKANLYPRVLNTYADIRARPLLNKIILVSSIILVVGALIVVLKNRNSNSKNSRINSYLNFEGKTPSSASHRTGSKVNSFASSSTFAGQSTSETRFRTNQNTTIERVKSLLRDKKPEEAIKLALRDHSISTDEKNKIFISIAQCYIRTGILGGDLNPVLAIIDFIADEDCKDRLLMMISDRYTDRGHLNEALETICKMSTRLKGLLQIKNIIIRLENMKNKQSRDNALEVLAYTYFMWNVKTQVDVARVSRINFSMLLNVLRVSIVNLYETHINNQPVKDVLDGIEMVYTSREFFDKFLNAYQNVHFGKPESSNSSGNRTSQSVKDEPYDKKLQLYIVSLDVIRKRILELRKSSDSDISSVPPEKLKEILRIENLVINMNFCPYAIAGVENGAEQLKVQKAFRALLELVHPDRFKHPRGKQIFDALNAAKSYFNDGGRISAVIEGSRIKSVGPEANPMWYSDDSDDY
jgi:hypothetical protein